MTEDYISKKAIFDPDRPNLKPRFEKISEIMARRNVGLFKAASEARAERREYRIAKRHENLKPENITRSLFGRTAGTAVAKIRGASQDEIRRAAGLKRPSPLVQQPVIENNKEALASIARNTKSTNSLLEELVGHYRKDDKRADIEDNFTKANQMRQEGLLRKMVHGLGVGAAVGGGIALTTSKKVKDEVSGGGGIMGLINTAVQGYLGYKAFKWLKGAVGIKGMGSTARPGSQGFTGSKAMFGLKKAAGVVAEKTSPWIKAFDEKVAPKIGDVLKKGAKSLGKFSPLLEKVGKSAAKAVGSKPIGTMLGGLGGLSSLGNKIARPFQAISNMRSGLGFLGIGTKLGAAARMAGSTSASAMAIYAGFMYDLMSGNAQTEKIHKIIDKMTPENLLVAKQKGQHWKEFTEPYVKQTAPEKLKAMEALEAKKKTGMLPQQSPQAPAAPNQFWDRPENKPGYNPPVKQAGTFLAGKPQSFNYDSYAKQMGDRESGGDYSKPNKPGHSYLGKYQMGAGALEDIGLLKKGASKLMKPLDDPNNWTIPGGKEAFLKDKDLQERSMKEYTNQHIDVLTKAGLIKPESSAKQIASYLAASHLGGPGNALKYFKEGADFADSNNTKVSSYAKLGEQSQNLEPPKSRLGPAIQVASDDARQSGSPTIIAPVTNNNVTNNNVSGGGQGSGQTASVRSDENSFRDAQAYAMRMGL